MFNWIIEVTKTQKLLHRKTACLAHLFDSTLNIGTKSNAALQLERTCIAGVTDILLNSIQDGYSFGDN